MAGWWPGSFSTGSSPALAPGSHQLGQMAWESEFLPSLIFRQGLMLGKGS